MTSIIPIRALVADSERPMIAKAAALLTDSLTQAGDHPWAADCTFAPSFEALLPTAGPCVIVMSLLPEVDRADEPWPETEARLRVQFQALCDNDQWTVFVCTVFRHVGRALPVEEAQRRRVRIRRLNLLAAELSREIGLLVADIDRDLADTGAVALDTDYRLLGAYAAAAAGKSVAKALLLVGLDTFAPFELQDAAREAVNAFSPPQGTPAAPPPLKQGGYVVSVRARQRTQIAEYAEAVADEGVAASHIKRLFSGKIGLADAATILGGALARRGLRQTAARFMIGLKAARARR